jgi:TPR repeat protein
MYMDRQQIILGLSEIRDPEMLFARQYLADAGIDLIASAEQARAYLQRKSTEGHPEAQLSLAKLLAIGLIGDMDRDEALHWCRRAADSGYGPAFVFLATFYSEGWGGLERDPERAIALLHKGAEADYPHAMALLALAYMEGVQVSKDRERGKKLLIQAAEHGEVSSQYLLGMELIRSENLAENTEGVRWLISAATENLPSAHRALANLYDEGAAGLPKDATRSASHRKRAEELEGRA